MLPWDPANAEYPWQVCLKESYMVPSSLWERTYAYGVRCTSQPNAVSTVTNSAMASTHVALGPPTSHQQDPPTLPSHQQWHCATYASAVARAPRCAQGLLPGEPGVFPFPMTTEQAGLKPLDASAVAEHLHPKIPSPPSYPPLNFFYTHFHDAIRAELENLTSEIRSLNIVQSAEDCEQTILNKLSGMQQSYRFLEQIYLYHTNVEDEVVYPALDQKVRNVTVSYTVEHQDESKLFEQLSQMLSVALTQSSSQRSETLRELMCKVEEINTTLRRHLAKEEEQLLPLLLQHFSYSEQAELVAQFLYCIPLATVEKVLAWLKPQVPPMAQEKLLEHIRGVVPDSLLLQLLVTWLQQLDAQAPQTDAGGYQQGTALHPPASAPASATPATLLMAQPSTTPTVEGGSSSSSTVLSTLPPSVAEQAAPDSSPSDHKPTPLHGIIHIHRSILSALEGFVRETRCLEQQWVAKGSDATAVQLSSLVEKLRFLRSVCMFHTASEEDVIYPELLRVVHGNADIAQSVCKTCTAEHIQEVGLFEDMVRLLSNARALARRGRKELRQILSDLCSTSERASLAVAVHMRREEREVIPMLQQHLTIPQQQAMLWRTLRAMPLRLLERVMPWVVAKLSEVEATELLTNIREGAPSPEMPLVMLLSRWAERGRSASVAEALQDASADSDDLRMFPNTTCEQHLLHVVPVARQGSVTLSNGNNNAAQGPVAQGLGADEGNMEGGSGGDRPSKRACTRHLDSAGVGCKPADVGDPNTADTGTAHTCHQHHHHHHQQHQRHQQHNQHQLPHHLLPAQQGPVGGLQHRPSLGASWPPQHVLAGGVQQRPSYGASLPQPCAPQLHAGAEAERAEAHRGMGDYCSSQTTSAPPSTSTAETHPGNSGQQQQQQQQRQQQQQQQQLQQQQQQQQLKQMRQQQEQQGEQGNGHPAPPGFNPIDHIFQFHRALRQELGQLEQDAVQVERAVQAAYKDGSSGGKAPDEGGHDAATEKLCPSLECAHAVKQLDGRFQFMWGIYRAHSRCEDEIVFPALESKYALRNVSHAYTLDHQQEETLFLDLSKVIEDIKGRLEAPVKAENPCCSRALQELALDLRRMCAAIRASVETHIHSEESELWPLFAEHFSFDEQQYLVGVIIGRTGAQVLQALMPWISESFPCDDKQALMDSLRMATKNTMFEQWLGAIQSKDTAAATGATQEVAAEPRCPSDAAAAAAAKTLTPGSAHVAASPAPSTANSGSGSCVNNLSRTLSDVLQYLAPSRGGDRAVGAGQCQSVAPRGIEGTPATDSALVDGSETGSLGPSAVPAAVGEIPGTVSESSSFRPGWEDIFRMNQQQLEAAIRKVSSDASLEPQRKAYLIQNIMVSRYIVGQQKRMRDSHAAGSAGGVSPGAAGGVSPGAAGGGPRPSPVGSDGALPAGGPSSAGGNEAPQLKLPESDPCDAVPPISGSTAAAPVLPGPPLVAACPIQTFHAPGSSVLGCEHYKRKCQLIAPCCGQAYTCRICHDNAADHTMDRYMVSEMRCMQCGLQQPVGQTCSGCSATMARYYCSICHLFDDEEGRDIYHCPFCNVCRRGKGLGVDFFHCMQCNACMSLSLFNSHKCREKAMEGNCPVCSEYLFHSSHPIKELPCGHFMHSACFADYTRYNYTCPICSKSIGDMTVYFQMLDSLLAAERLPADYQGRTQMILCNDCGRSGFAPFHFVYHCCPHCRSYNTRVT